MNTYRATSEYGRAVFGEDVFEMEFSATEEADHLGAGHVEIVPRGYRQLSNNYSATEQGETFEAALLVEQEAALIQGGHLKRVDPDEQPPGNAKRAEWAKYALKHGASKDDLLDEDGKALGRDELRAKFGVNT
jgi:hypothetical protein